MKDKTEYSFSERIDLMKRYRGEGQGCTGTAFGRKWYRRGLGYGIKGNRYDTKNYIYYYEYEKFVKSYSRKGLYFFEKAAKCFKKAAKYGNDLAIMNYALYLYTFKDQDAEALALFERASDLGLAVADYQLHTFYKYGFCGLKADEEKSAYYRERFRDRIFEDERQFILAWDVELDNAVGAVLGRGYMFAWFYGFSYCERYDSFATYPSEWKYKND